MSSNKKKLKASVGNPYLLDSLDPNENILQVVIETPKGSRNKYAFDEKQRVFGLKKVLPAGMEFPCDFGFVPSTLARAAIPAHCGAGSLESSRAHKERKRIVAGMVVSSQSKRRTIASRTFIMSRTWAKHS